MTPAQKIAEATEYLEGEGGLGEMGVCAQAVFEAGMPFVGMSPAVAIALLALAAEALNNRVSEVDRAKFAYVAAQLRALSDSMSEGMSDKRRLDAFVAYGAEAANGLDLLAERTATPNKPSVN